MQFECPLIFEKDSIRTALSIRPTGFGGTCAVKELPQQHHLRHFAVCLLRACLANTHFRVMICMGETSLSLQIL